MKLNITKSLILPFIFMLASHTTGYADTPDDVVVDFYAQEFHVSREEAIKRLDMMANSEPIINELQNTFGSSITSIYFDNGAEFKLVVRTTAKGQDLKGLRELAGSQNQIPVLIIKNSPKNANAIANIIQNQGARLSKQIDGFAMLGYDGVQDKIVITIYEPNMNKRAEIKNRPTLQKIAGMETEFVFLEEPLETKNLKDRVPIIRNTKICNNCY